MFEYLDYGNVSIDGVSPKCGPMNEEVLMFVNLKGRVTKNDLKVFLTMPNNDWRYNVETLTVNAAVAYFKLPSCPVPNQRKVKIDVHIHFRGQPIHSCPFYYLSCIDGKFHRHVDQLLIHLKFIFHLEQLASMENDSLFDLVQPSTVNNSRRPSSSGPLRRLHRRRRN